MDGLVLAKKEVKYVFLMCLLNGTIFFYYVTKMGQTEVLQFLKKYPDTWFSVKELKDALGYDNIQTNVFRLKKWNFVHVMRKRTEQHRQPKQYIKHKDI